jgi:NAD(P)H dehydrogenase (quinone)
MILVSGANGNLAQAIIGNLLSQLEDNSRLAVGTRTPDSGYARQLAERGVTVRHLDFLDTSSLEKALIGIDKALFISTYEPNDIRIKQHSSAIDAAVRSGTRHIIYTSFINAVPTSAFEHNSQVHAPTEQMILNSGLQYTILRHSLYTEFLVSDLALTLQSGKLKRGGGVGRISFIGRDDLGVSAAQVLAGDGHVNRVYTETGPEAISYAEAAAIMSEVFGVSIEHEDLEPDDWYAHSLGLGFPEPLARASASNVRAVLQGEFSEISPDYESITGRPARTVRQYLDDKREKFLALAG